MTKEAQRIAIAKVCGCRMHFQNTMCSFPNAEKNTRWFRILFDPLEDLNAMAEVENLIFAKGAASKKAWCENLRNVVCGEYWIDWQSHRATAAQRAEAFLKTTDRWKENA